MNLEGVRVCCILSIARALHGWPEGSLKSRSFRVYGVTNMFSAELEPHTQNLVPRRSMVEHFEREGGCACQWS